MSTSTQTLGIIVESEGSQILLRDPDAIRFATDMLAEGRVVRLMVAGSRAVPTTMHVAVQCRPDEVDTVAALTDAPTGVDVAGAARRVYCLADDGELLTMAPSRSRDAVTATAGASA